MPRQVARHFAAAGGVADVDCILEIKFLGERRQVVGVMIHVMAARGLGGAAMAAPVVGYDAIAVIEEEHHLGVPVIRAQRPAVAKDNGLSRTPVLEVNLRSVFGGNCAHW